jgi:hypothetical protein
MAKSAAGPMPSTETPGVDEPAQRQHVPEQLRQRVLVADPESRAMSARAKSGSSCSLGASAPVRGILEATRLRDTFGT